ncbi:MAG: trigger factor [Fusobacteriaceae bacterium]|jgi:trigger factor|nr:trigger factor [Fusobacteriaceae bacterium]
MNHQIKKLENSAVEVTIALTGEEVFPLKTQILNEMKDKVEIKGFRKGKAPFERIEQEYKEKVIGQVVEKMLDKYYDQVIKEEGIVPITYISQLKTDLKGSGIDIIFNLDVYPDIELGEYKELEAEKGTFVMSDEILNKELELIVNSKSQLESTEKDYKAQLGDTVDIAFEGFVDGVPFTGGKSDSHILKLGSKMFIDTFEDQLVGYVFGQEGEVNVTFPENYHQKDLANKLAIFKVKINSIKKLKVPELNDELAKEIGYENLEDLKIKKNDEIQKREEKKIDNEYRIKLLDKIAAGSKIELPFSMIANEIGNRIREMEQQLSMQGIKLETYLEMTGMDIAKLEKQVAPIAAMKVKSDLLLENIAKKEGIETNEEEITNRMTEIATYYGINLEKLQEEMNKKGNMENFKKSVSAEIILEKAMDFVVNSAKK